MLLDLLYHIKALDVCLGCMSGGESSFEGRNHAISDTHNMNARTDQEAFAIDKFERKQVYSGRFVTNQQS